MKTRGRRGLRVSAGIMLLALAAWVSRVGATHSLLEHVSQGALNGNGPHAAVFVGASADGSHVFFLTAEALADTDTDTAFDLYERAGGQTTHVSQGEINGNSSTAFVSYLGASADGSRVFFGTAEPLVSGDTDTRTDIYERFQGQTTQVSAGNGAVDVTYQAASADGTHVFFTTTESLMVSDTDVNRIDIYERDHGALVHVTEARQPGAFPEDALFRGISVDGTHVFFDTFEEVLASDDETGGAATDVYERFGGQTFHVTIGSNALRSCTFVGASADGSRVFFATNDSFDSVTDTDTTGDIYERFAGGTFHVSQGAINGNGPEAVTFVDASADGTRVVFKTLERLAATDSDNAEDLYERAGGQTLHVTRGAINGNGTPPCFFLGASADGSRIFFSTTEQLDSTDTDASIDVYERVAAMTTTQVSRGDVNGNLAFHATFKAASADGTRVFFETSEVLAATDADGSVDIYERAEGQTTQVSSGNGPQGPTFAGKSLDGGHVFFTSVERLAGTDTDDSSDIYDAHVLTGPADLIFGDGFEAGAPSAG